MTAGVTSARPGGAPEAGRPAVRRRTEAELTRQQVEAIDAWHRARREVEEAARVREASREARMDLARQLEVLRSQHAAIVARADRSLAERVRPTGRQAPLRAVLVHRHAWYVDKVAAGLQEAGVVVVDRLENGAEAVGAVVVEQPDLLLVEDVLPMLPGEQVVRETRAFSPGTVVVGQVAHADRAPAMLAAGAHTAVTRQVPPLDVARDALVLLAGQG